ncbi:hypothetical protein GGI42DRAFT_350952 [Trichoderma sp. SZMC 28013]
MDQPNGPVLLEAFHNHFYPSWAHFRSPIEPVKVECIETRSMIPWWASNKDQIHFNYNLSGGTIMAMDTYNFAALRLLFGDSPEVCASCDVKAFTDGIHDECDYEFQATFRFLNGGIGIASRTRMGEAIINSSGHCLGIPKKLASPTILFQPARQSTRSLSWPFRASATSSFR